MPSARTATTSPMLPKPPSWLPQDQSGPRITTAPSWGSRRTCTSSRMLMRPPAASMDLGASTGLLGKGGLGAGSGGAAYTGTEVTIGGAEP